MSWVMSPGKHELTNASQEDARQNNKQIKKKKQASTSLRTFKLLNMTAKTLLATTCVILIMQ